MSATVSPAAAVAAAADRPRHPVALRSGLILAVVVSGLSAIPAVGEIGLDGTAWDVLVIFLAILTPIIALTAIVLLPFAWTGRRTPATVVAVSQLVAILGLWPGVVLYFVDGLPIIAPISAALTIAVEVLVAWLILRGMRARS